MDGFQSDQHDSTKEERMTMQCRKKRDGLFPANLGERLSNLTNWLCNLPPFIYVHGVPMLQYAVNSRCHTMIRCTLFGSGIYNVKLTW